MVLKNKNIVALTGAGISAESGIKTFRDHGGLWEEHDILEMASPQGWQKNKSLVLDFYNKRRAQLKSVQPNLAHQFSYKLELENHVTIITQNVDDLHERAGSSNIIHLHGELKKARSEKNPELIIDTDGDINIGDVADDGAQLRPHIVWFGEEVPKMELAQIVVSKADICFIIGTSMQVYPAANLVHYCNPQCKIYYIDPNPCMDIQLKNVHAIPLKATIGLPKVISDLNIYFE